MIIDKIILRRANFKTKIFEDHEEKGGLFNKEFGRKGSSAHKKAAGEKSFKTRPSKQYKSLIF